MDYDENDFQSQNIQLSGEDSTRFPPNLQTYTLPKYDLDEHFQVHLGFCIDEAEVLLGIQSQQDSNWIEEFSRGSNEIEFGSSAAESCSIARRHNVWSEATSSESVEMLLKSVGQDEPVTRQTIVEESDACDGFDSINEQTDYSMNRDKIFPSAMGGPTGNSPTVAPDKYMENLRGPSENAELHLPRVEGTSYTHKDEESHSEDMSAVDLIDPGKYVLEGNEVSSLSDRSTEKSAENDHCSGTIAAGNGNSGIISLENEQVDPSTMSIVNLGTIAVEPNNQMVLHQVAEGPTEVVSEKALGSQKDEAEKGENPSSSKGVHIKEKVETNPCLVEVVSLCADSDKDDCTNANALEISFETTKGNTKFGGGSSNDETKDEKPQNILEIVDRKEENEVSPSVMEFEQMIKGESSSNVKGNTVCTSMKIYSPAHLNQTTDVEKDGDDSLGNHAAKFTSQDPPPLILVDEVIESDSDVSRDVILDQQPLVTINKAVSEDSRSSDHDNLEFTSVGSFTENNTVAAEGQGSLLEPKVGVESVLVGFVSGDLTELPPSSKLESVQQLCLGNSLVVDVAVEEKEAAMPSLPVSDIVNVDKKEESVGISSEPSSLIPVTKADSDQHPVRNSDVDVSSDTIDIDLPPDGVDVNLSSAAVSIRAPDIPFDSVVQSTAVLDKPFNLKHNDEPETSKADTTAQEHGKGLAGDSTSKSYAVSETSASCIIAIAATDGDIVPSYAGESSNDINQGVHKGEAFLGCTQGDIPKQCEKRSGNSLAEIISIPKAVETANGRNSAETDSGSPTVITSDKQEKKHLDGNARLTDQNESVRDKPSWVPFTDVQADIVRSTGNDVPEDNRSFTFEVASLADLSERETDKAWKPFSSVQPLEVHQSPEVCPTSGLCSTDPGIIEEPCGESKQASNAHGAHMGSAKITGRDKSPPFSGSTAPRGTSTKGKPLRDPSSQKHQAATDGIFSSLSSNSSGKIKRAMQVEEIQPYPYNDVNMKESPAVPTFQTSNLPDLNSLDSPALFHQPFSDFQQVQLRAQIFVYGSLIQGTAPDEACMVSAFGDSGRDGGRSMWESTWRVAVESFYSQKSPLTNLETPVHSHSGFRTPEPVSRCDSLQGKLPNTVAGRSGSKSGAPSLVLNSTMSLSSPLWSITTPSRDALLFNMPRGSFVDPHHSLSQWNLYHSPQMRQYMGDITPLLSQASAPLPSPWVFPPQISTLGIGQQYSEPSVAESIQVTPVRDTSALRSAAVQLASPSPMVPTVGLTNIQLSPAMLKDAKRTKPSSGNHSSLDQKSKKRKKNLSPQEINLASQVMQSGTETSSVNAVTMHLTTSSGSLSPSHPTSSKISAGSFVLTSSPLVSSTHFQVLGGGGDMQRVVFPEETSKRVEQAKVQAEDAASLAVSAVRHCQGIRSQLFVQKRSGLVSEVEEKLASAAVAAAAAASVAKAASAAAKIASDAALQAKLMADDALGIGNSAQDADTIFSNGGGTLSRMSLTSILKGKDKVNNSNFIIAAREVARRRVEAASVAAKQAENLDAVVKAAGIAAEAVAQAGTIIGMGDPVPMELSELFEMSPDGYWKLQPIPAEDRREQNRVNADEGFGRSTANTNQISERPSNKKDAQDNDKCLRPPTEVSRQSGKDRELVNRMNWDSVVTEKQLGGHKGRKRSDLSKTIGIIPESEVGPGAIASLTPLNDESDKDQQVESSKINGITEGSIVEVFSDEDAFRGAWFSSKVLSVKEGKAFVGYDKLLQNEGPDILKEWVALVGEGDKPPRIRIAHPMTTAMRYEGTRKRRRAAMGMYTWYVGDRVDVWMRDGWWEAVVTERDKDDDTKLTVQFPAEGNSSIVRSWSLRPSLIWKNHEWIEWSRDNNCWPTEGDVPNEKRQKLGLHEVARGSKVEDKGKEVLPKDPGIEPRKADESWPQMLFGKDKIFTIGKNVGRQNNLDVHKIKRTGLQKEGSKVVFGVPKPGKKRKFMDVSKHYIADRGASKSKAGTDSMTFTKYLMPQVSSRGWKNANKVDSRQKQPSDHKAKVMRSGKTQLPLQSNIVIEKGTPSVSTGQDPVLNTKSSVSHENNTMEKENLIEAGSRSTTVGESELAGSVFVPSNNLSSKKPSSTGEPEKVGKRNLGPGGGKLNGGEEKGSIVNDHHANLIPDPIEPRRSNRRIQPTSRLLEGLQSSSLNVAKMPPLSHDKSMKARQRILSSSRGNHG